MIKTNIKNIFLFILLILSWNLFSYNDLGFLYCNGTKIEDGNNEILLKGVHVTNAAYGTWIYPISEELEAKGHCPMIPPEILPDWSLRSMDFDNINNLGANVVRYELNYELFAEANENRTYNLTKLKNDVKKFNDLGIYVILDHHYMPGIDTMSAQYEDLNKESVRLKSIFECEELWDEFVKWWKYIANEFKDNPGIAGYEPFVEPRIPTDKEGGIDQFLKKYNEICEVIRSIDTKHIIFIPQSHSKEIGDSIEWEEKLYKVDNKFKNIVYTFMMYEPWEFSSNGKKYTTDELEKEISEYLQYRIDFSLEHNVPLLINEYGVNQYQSRKNVLNFLEILHEKTMENSISTVYYSYKAEAGPWGDGYHNMGLYSEYHSYKDDLNISGNSYKFNKSVLNVAKKTGFYDTFYKYFYVDNKFTTTSVTNNDILMDHFKEYFSE